MLFEQNKDIRYVSKWIRMPVKLFITSINITNQILIQTNKNVKKITKINRLLNVKGLVQIYMGLNRGKCINTKGILDFINPCNL